MFSKEELGRELVSLDRYGEKEKVWEKKRSGKQLEIKRYETLADFWRWSQTVQGKEGYIVPLVQSKLYAVDHQNYYLQAGLKKDIVLVQNQYYVSSEKPNKMRLNGLDLFFSCMPSVRAHFRYQRWFFSNRYYRRKIGEVLEYRRASLWKFYREERIRLHSSKYVCSILSNGLLVRWNRLIGRFSSRPDWEVKSLLYSEKKKCLEEVYDSNWSGVLPKPVSLGSKLEVRSHWKKAIKKGRRFSFYVRKRKKVRLRNWNPIGSTYVIFMKTGSVEREEKIFFRKVVLDLLPLRSLSRVR